MKILGLVREGAGSYYRVRQPLAELACHGHETDVRQAGSEETADGFDVLVGHMIGSPDQGVVVNNWWRELARRCRRVYELDDDPFEIEHHNPVWWAYGTELSRDSLRHCIQTADLVTASVEPLAERMRKLNPNVVVCKNRVDESLLRVERPRRDRVTIGWAGGASHRDDVKEAAYGLRRVLQRHPGVDMHFIGMDYSSLVRRPARFTKWSDDIFGYYRAIDFDVGVAPLRSTVFAETKSCIKALEYAALGIPVVASDVAPYRDFVIDGVTGWLVRREHEWALRLRELVNDEAMRAEMGAKAREHAAGHTIQKGWRDWESAYASIL